MLCPLFWEQCLTLYHVCSPEWAYESIQKALKFESVRTVSEAGHFVSSRRHLSGESDILTCTVRSSKRTLSALLMPLRRSLRGCSAPRRPECERANTCCNCSHGITLCARRLRMWKDAMEFGFPTTPRCGMCVILIYVWTFDTSMKIDYEYSN